jgi:hypothetical protein
MKIDKSQEREEGSVFGEVRERKREWSETEWDERECVG